MVKAPHVCGLILCESFKVDPPRRRISLEGLFLIREYPVFPAASGPFTVYAALFDGRGEGELCLSCTHLESEKEVYYHKKWIAFPEGGRTIHLEIPARKLNFPKPGRYSFTLLFNKEPLTVRYLDIRRQKHGSP